MKGHGKSLGSSYTKSDSARRLSTRDQMHKLVDFGESDKQIVYLTPLGDLLPLIVRTYIINAASQQSKHKIQISECRSVGSEFL